MARNIFSVPQQTDQFVVRDNSWMSNLVRGAWIAAPKDVRITDASSELKERYDCTKALHLDLGVKMDLPFRGEEEGADDDVLVLSIARGEGRPTSGFYKPLVEVLPFVDKASWKDLVLRKDIIARAKEDEELVKAFKAIRK